MTKQKTPPAPPPLPERKDVQIIGDASVCSTIKKTVYDRLLTTYQQELARQNQGGDFKRMAKFEKEISGLKSLSYEEVNYNKATLMLEPKTLQAILASHGIDSAPEHAHLVAMHMLFCKEPSSADVRRQITKEIFTKNVASYSETIQKALDTETPACHFKDTRALESDGLPADLKDKITQIIDKQLPPGMCVAPEQEDDQNTAVTGAVPDPWANIKIIQGGAITTR